MRGRLVTLVWQHDPALHAPPGYRRAREYEAFIPDPLTGVDFHLDARTASIIPETERAIRDLNAAVRPALAPLARLLLRTESIASSRVEAMQIGARELARVDARVETGGNADPNALEILANIDAMELAIHEAAAVDRSSVDEIRAIHRRLMEGTPGFPGAGRVRTVQGWIGGNDYNPCGAGFVPPPEYVSELLEDLCAAINDDSLPPLVQAALVHAQFETIHPFDDGNGRTGRALIHIVLRRDLAPSYVLPISVVLATRRESYIEALIRYRAGEIDAWLAHFAAAATGRAKSAVHRAIGDLEAAGVLPPRSRSRRNRSWEAAGLLDLLAGLGAVGAGEPPAS